MMKTLLLLFLSASSILAEEDFTVGSRIFTGSVYNELLVDNKDNILVSPFSVETVLALTQSGAVGDTGAEIRTTLHLPETKEETEAVIKKVLPTIQGDQFTLKTANKIYVEENYPIKETFQKVATDVYQASFQNVEFSQTTEAAAEINQWVEENTNGKIHDLVVPDNLSASTKVVLINALYFQGNWSIPFQPLYTTKKSFFTSTEDTVDIDMMYKQSEEYNYAESEELDAKILELPFLGEDASFTIVLPNKKEGIAVLEKQIDSVLANADFTKEFVEVSLPKFRIESTIDFNEVLMNMGVQKAFDPATADFSGIAGEPGELFITQVMQKTFIDVNEIGVEAAAATEIGEGDSLPPEATKTFIVDHPFIFYIKVRDVVLFEGRVVLPQYEN